MPIKEKFYSWLKYWTGKTANCKFPLLNGLWYFEYLTQTMLVKHTLMQRSVEPRLLLRTLICGIVRI